jgi:hypothetical protein
LQELWDKTFLMLPYLNEWRWFDDEKKTPWYDSVEIFKQKQKAIGALLQMP